MTGDLAAAAEGCHIFTGCGYPAPGLDDFNFRKLFSIGGWNVTKPELIAILCVIIIIAFFWAAFAKPKMIPGKTQSLGEMAVLAVRDQIVRPVLGAKGDSYMPFLTSLFFWILVMNLMELIPVLQFPSMSRIGFVWPLVGVVYIFYWYLGFKTKGFIGYFRSWVPNAPWFIMPILIPVEILKYVFIQPFTLGVRLFANMFAGPPAAVHLHGRDLVPDQPVDRPAVRGGLALHGVLRLPARAPRRPPAGVHLHHADRYLHRGLPGARPLSRAGRPQLNSLALQPGGQEPPDRPKRKN